MIKKELLDRFDEAIIPLTFNWVPFRVRYTLECDENARPLKAYVSAAIVIDEK